MHKRLRLTLATAAAATLTGGLLTLSAATATAAPTPGGTHADADFNGDGIGDVATTATRAYVDGKKAAGEIVVLYGGGAHTTISQNSPGVPGTAETEDYFGSDLAWGDFDGDGYDDLATGAGGEDVGSDTDGGTAVILWGSASGLHGGTTVKDPRPTEHDRFGGILEAADLNGDGHVDLALGTTTSATVDIYRGGFTRSGSTGGHYTLSPPIVSGNGDGLRNLHSGDANGDGVEDLIVNGYENDSVDGYDANFWFPGSASGVRSGTSQKLPAGFITDVGDTDGDGLDDVIIGAGGENGDNGAVYALRSGSDGSLTAPSGIYTSTVGVSGSGTPLLGNNFAD